MNANMSEDVRACIEVGKELNHISRLIEKDIRQGHHLYKEKSKLTNLVNGPHDWGRYHEDIHKWPWVQIGRSKCMKLICKAVADCILCARVPSARSRLGSSCRQVVVAGGILIGVVVASIGICYFQYDQPNAVAS